MPASSPAWRPTFWPCSPIWNPQPIMTSSVCAKSTPGLRSTSALSGTAARSSARTSLSEPLTARPIGVRTASTMTASGMVPPLIDCSVNGTPEGSAPYPEVMAESPPSNRIGRSARLGGLVAGQSARWAGTRAANLVRSPEEADAATGERAAALARELVKQLGQLRGAAMKVGQVLSTVDFTAIPESEREEFKTTLAALRDDVPPLPFKKVRKLLEDELGGKVADHFETFEEEAFAAASIGQVHRAVTLAGDEVAVKVQYPGVAEAVESDLRNLSLLLPLVKRLAPGLDVKALYGELRERIAEELDYEIE